MMKRKTRLKTNKPLRPRNLQEFKEKGYKSLNKVSQKQFVINKLLSDKRKGLLKWMLETHGYTFCQKCLKNTPAFDLELVHGKGRGRGGSPLDDSNIKGLWCTGLTHFPGCHYGEKLGDHYNED